MKPSACSDTYSSSPLKSHLMLSPWTHPTPVFILKNAGQGIAGAVHTMKRQRGARGTKGADWQEWQTRRGFGTSSTWTHSLNSSQAAAAAAAATHRYWRSFYRNPSLSEVFWLHFVAHHPVPECFSILLLPLLFFLLTVLQPCSSSLASGHLFFLSRRGDGFA